MREKKVHHRKKKRKKGINKIEATLDRLGN